MQLSYHALEQITDRNIDESQVEHALMFGARWTCKYDKEIRYARLNDIMVVTQGDDWVLTAYKIGGERGTALNTGKGRQACH